LFITNNIEEQKIIDSVSGGYNISNLIQQGNNSIVPGEMIIKGLKENLDITIIFKSTRYAVNDLFEEGIRVLSKQGVLEGEAIYQDSGSGNISNDGFALYEILTTTGEFREMKGHFLKIEFNNTVLCKPRKISLVQGFGPKKKNAKIFS
jgi:hypothetical protein